MKKAIILGMIAVSIAGLGVWYFFCTGGPAADFSAQKTELAWAQEVTFTDLSSGNPTEWLWDFGDGSTSTEQNPSHSYSTLGGFTVTLKASNGEGSDTKTAEHYISVFMVLEEDKPLDDIAQAIASSKGVSENDVDIHFCDPATEDASAFAVGATISNDTSTAFIYAVDSGQISSTKADYTADSAEKKSALSSASRYVSGWTGSSIVPCDFEASDGNYEFTYYDGYAILTGWSYGTATVDVNTGAVEWDTHGED